MSVLQNLEAWAKTLTGYLVYLLIISTLGPFLFGYHLGELNAPQEVITCQKRSIRVSGPGLPQCIPMTTVQVGMVSSAFTVGGLFGALAAGPLATKYGRLTPIRITTVFATLGPIGEALAPNIGVMAAGRLVSGIGAGAALVVVPLYVAEIAPPSGRGFFGAFTQIMINAGIFTAQLLGYFLSHDAVWRVILAVAGGVALLQLSGLTFAIDSPKWQADHGEPGMAKINLRRIRGQDADLTEEIREWKFKAADDGEQETLIGHEDHDINHRRSSKSKDGSLGTFEVWNHPHYPRATLCVMMVLAAQQLCGINSIIMYGVSLLSGILSAHSALLNIFVSVLNVVMTIACAPLIDIIGRKPCLLGSIGGMGSSSILLAIGIKGSIPILSTVAVLLFVASFALGLGPVPFMLSSELVGPEAVSATQSWGLAANWIATFLVAQFFPLLNERMGRGNIYFVFAALAAVFFTLTLFFVPETKGTKNADEAWGRVPRSELDD